jgi:type IV secretory pathway VirJ component
LIQIIAAAAPQTHIVILGTDRGAAGAQAMTRMSPNLLILALGGAALALGGCSGKSAAPAASEAAAEPTAVSTDWTVQNPTDPAVPVNLPTTKMTNAPAEAAMPAATEAAPKK